MRNVIANIRRRWSVSCRTPGRRAAFVLLCFLLAGVGSVYAQCGEPDVRTRFNPVGGGTVTRDGLMIGSAHAKVAEDKHNEAIASIAFSRGSEILSTRVLARVDVVWGHVEAGGAPLGGYATAGVALRLEVRRPRTGVVVCSDEIVLAKKGTPGFYVEKGLDRGVRELFCNAPRTSPDGRPLQARVGLRTWAVAGAAAGSRAEAEVDIQSITLEHCQPRIAWCRHEGATLYAGDFDGDGLDDLLCHTVPGSGWIDIDFSRDGLEGRNDFQNGFGWCSHDGAELLVGDVDGDGMDDLVCHTAANGIIDVDRARNGFGGNDWQSSDGWCFHSGATLRLGDVDGDGDDDLICHTRPSGWTDLSLARGGRFTMRNNHQVSRPWCNRTGATLHVGDVDGDGRADLICHTTTNGRIEVDLADRAGHFAGTSDIDSSPRGWCFHTGASFLVADADGDGRDDLLCQTSNSGFVDVDLAADGRFLGNDRQNDFDFCMVENPRLLAGIFFADVEGEARGASLVCQDPATRESTILPAAF